MKKRITLSLDEKLIRMIKSKQADLILEKNGQISTSNVVSSILYKWIKTDEYINSKLESVYSNVR